MADRKRTKPELIRHVANLRYLREMGSKRLLDNTCTGCEATFMERWARDACEAWHNEK
jgi:hypothetical protein